ncbi:hypothetical protein CLV79_107147 [Limimaricola soesokkakensis]|uniref:Uncharacterized protein n=1 Tax=Limimaricola soesokkakensis TaxID=1343159 RepID=A0A1X6ZNQ3_9RHOB|nr:hypothetical protein [Limimaricola soesokkakensis]PSK85917.1 hypothetical protein CLV79_107147 [Limimaricola soesokkakensis]SLN55109.1 hypothetical protein LOS8367_02593 [Limimaricola soesokkakensis]
MVSRTTATFSRAFTLPGFDEMLPAGEYDLETELAAPLDHLDPEGWKASVRVYLHPRGSHPGLSRSLTVSLADLELALIKDGLSDTDLRHAFLEGMLADPLVRLLMQADQVSAAELRRLHASPPPREARRVKTAELSSMAKALRTFADRLAIQSAENEGMPIRNRHRSS